MRLSGHRCFLVVRSRMTSDQHTPLAPAVNPREQLRDPAPRWPRDWTSVASHEACARELCERDARGGEGQDAGPTLSRTPSGSSDPSPLCAPPTAETMRRRRTSASLDFWIEAIVLRTPGDSHARLP